MISFANLLSSNWRHRAAAAGLIRRLQTTVEHMRVTNATVADMVRGEIIALTAGDRRAVLAQADALATSEWVGVVCEPIADGETGIVRTNGRAWVLFVDGLTLAAGEPIYLSVATAGRATNVEPFAPPGYMVRIGTIVDASPYVGDGVDNGCWVQLQRCCAPVD